MSQLENQIELCKGVVDPMTKEQLAHIISSAINKDKGKLERFHSFQCIRSYFSDLSIEHLKEIAEQYKIKI